MVHVLVRHVAKVTHRIKLQDDIRQADTQAGVLLDHVQNLVIDNGEALLSVFGVRPTVFPDGLTGVEDVFVEDVIDRVFLCQQDFDQHEVFRPTDVITVSAGEMLFPVGGSLFAPIAVRADHEAHGFVREHEIVRVDGNILAAHVFVTGVHAIRPFFRVKRHQTHEFRFVTLFDVFDDLILSHPVETDTTGVTNGFPDVEEYVIMITVFEFFLFLRFVVVFTRLPVKEIAVTSLHFLEGNSLCPHGCLVEV